MNTEEKIKSNLSRMTKSEKRIAAYFFENSDDFAFETLDTIAKKMNTSTTSIIRFCRKLGFSGYKPFREGLRKDFKNELTLPDKLERTAKSGSITSNLSQNMENAIRCIEETFNSLSPALIFESVNALINSKRVFCFGLKESFALSHYAYTRFLTVRDNVFMLSAGQNGEIESVLSLKKGDVCVCFLFHRYTRQSPKILELIKKQGAYVILITSPPYDKVEKNADLILPCNVDIKGIKNSAVAPVCIIDHMCNEIAISGGNDTLEYMKKSEELFKDFVF